MKYYFDKSSKKFNCPKCNKKRFVRFVSAETNEYLVEGFGKCDRESSCGYFKKPDGTIATLSTHQVVNGFNNASPINYHSREDLQNSLRKYYSNNFYERDLL